MSNSVHDDSPTVILNPPSSGEEYQPAKEINQ